MSDPGAPSYTLPTQWATAGSYPAGSNPWSGQPVVVAPGSINYWTPGQTLPAEILNYLLNVRDATDVNAKSYLTALHQWVNDADTLIKTSASNIVGKSGL